MPLRNLLHKSKLNEFVEWCKKSNIPTKPPSGAFQVIKVYVKGKGFLPIYFTLRNDEHFTVEWRLEGIVRRFINETRKPKKKINGVSNNAQTEQEIFSQNQEQENECDSEDKKSREEKTCMR